MEKQAVIKPGVTPPERDDQKSAEQLESHPKQRLADHVAKSIRQPPDKK